MGHFLVPRRDRQCEAGPTRGQSTRRPAIWVLAASALALTSCSTGGSRPLSESEGVLTAPTQSPGSAEGGEPQPTRLPTRGQASTTTTAPVVRPRPVRPPTRPQVRLPSSVSGVRGTTFAIEVVDAPAAREPDGDPRQTRQAPQPSTALAQSAPPAVGTTDPCASNEPPGLNLPVYEQWPPEEASSRVSLDRFIGERGGLSLYDTGVRLRDALNEAGYQQHAFYAVPGGYIIVTETERTDPSGQGLSGVARYQMPGEDRTGLLISIRDLFLERPRTYYRYLAIVVSDSPFCVDRAALTIEQAQQRVLGGFTDLGDDARNVAFDDRYRVTALIYEFANDGIGYDLAMIAPGRIPPQDHLELTGLARALPRVFGQSRDGDE